MYIDLHVKGPLFLSDFKEIRIFSTILRKIPQILNFMKIRPVGAELFQRTDITMLIVAFRKFANTPKNTRKLKQLDMMR